MTALSTDRLGRRYGSRWALRDCTLELPAGAVIGLVGPNGAGKTTLIHIAAGLLRATAGSATVFGEPPGSRAALARTGFVAQDKPLYPGFTVADTLRMGGWLNPGWDARLARERLARLAVPLGQRVGKLSGGQRAQVALALALGKRPGFLLLDEPVASLDPLARKEFMATLMEAVAGTGATVLLSSHLIADLDQVCDYLVVLSASRVQVAGAVEDLLSGHLTLSGPLASAAAIHETHTVITDGYSGQHATMLVRAKGAIGDPSWTARNATLEELVLGYMQAGARGGEAAA
jgi:ABC-2 type transport system ATP-binding protein